MSQKEPQSRGDYKEFVRAIADGAQEMGEGDNCEFVAKRAIQYFELVGDEIACTSSAEPYALEWSRINPWTVLQCTDQEFDVDRANRLARKTAVGVLRQDLEKYIRYRGGNPCVVKENKNGDETTLTYKDQEVTFRLDDAGWKSKVTVMTSSCAACQVAKQVLKNSYWNEVNAHTDSGSHIISTEWVEIGTYDPYGIPLAELADHAHERGDMELVSRVAHSQTGHELVLMLIHK